MDWYTSFTGKFGYKFDDWLVYGKGGIAMADASIVGTSSVTLDGTPAGLASPQALGLPPGTTASTASVSQLLFGPTFGFGAEKRLSDTISIGAEYNYVSLPSFTGQIPGPFNGGASAPVFRAGFHTVKASLNYHF